MTRGRYRHLTGGDLSEEPSVSDTKRPSPASDYDEFVDWNKRLAREAPLFRRVFEEVGAHKVADVGAGSARHSIMFATWGLEVLAVDPDDSMLAQAERNVAERADEVAAAGGSIRLVRGGFGELVALGVGPCDVLICTGNALPHVDGLAGLRVAFADFALVVREGGALVLHLLNHAKLLSARPRAIPPVFRQTAEGEKVFLRVIDYPEGAEYLGFDFLTLVRDAEGEWEVTHRRSPHTALPLELLERELGVAGFGEVQAFGSHDGRPFDAEKDESVIVVARLRG
jgi:glycine/sarcosine N-methyltransferase